MDTTASRMTNSRSTPSKCALSRKNISHGEGGAGYPTRSTSSHRGRSRRPWIPGHWWMTAGAAPDSRFRVIGLAPSCPATDGDPRGTVLVVYLVPAATPLDGRWLVVTAWPAGQQQRKVYWEEHDE